MTPLVTIENLRMDFDGKTVLKDINFTIGEKEVIGIIGRSGAGKTVLMHLIRGVDQPPTSGRILYHVAACDRCEWVDLPSTIGKTCPACGGSMKALDVDFWDERNEAFKRRIFEL